MRDYVIIIPENASECLQYCAEELNLFVNKTSGKNLDILSDNEFVCKDGLNYVSIGNTVQFREANYNLDLDRLNGDGFYLKNDNNNLFIVGACDRATLYGVYELAERNGVKFLSSDYTYYPKLKEFKFSGYGYVKEVPDFKFRGVAFRAVFRKDADKVLYARRRNSHELIKVEEKYGGQISFAHCAKELTHNTMEYVPLEEYFATEEQKVANRDMYVFNDKGEPFDICWTNGIKEDGTIDEEKEVSTLKAVIKTLKEHVLKEPNAEYYFIGQMDYDRACDCKNCLASKLKFQQAGTQIRFLNEVVRIVNDWAKTQKGLENKVVKICTLSYLYSTDAPVKKDKDGKYVAIDDTVIPDERICIRLTPYRANWFYALSDKRQTEQYHHYIEKWQAIASNFSVWDYGTQYSNYFIYFPIIHRIKKSLKEFKDAGVWYMFLQLAHSEFEVCSVMHSYIYEKLMWKINQNPYKIRKEFIKYYFGEKHGVVLRLVRWWDKLYKKNERKSFGEFVKKALLDGVYYPADVMEKFIAEIDDAIEFELNNGGENKEVFIRHFEEIKLFPLHTLFRARKELFYGDFEKQKRVYDDFFALTEKLNLSDYGEGLRLTNLRTLEGM